MYKNDGIAKLNFIEFQLHSVKKRKMSEAATLWIVEVRTHTHRNSGTKKERELFSGHRKMKRVILKLLSRILKLKIEAHFGFWLVEMKVKERSEHKMKCMASVNQLYALLIARFGQKSSARMHAFTKAIPPEKRERESSNHPPLQLCINMIHFNL